MTAKEPTTEGNWEPAIRAYIEGERLCDSEQFREGIRSFSTAYNLAWELEQEVWPAWATGLHAALAAAVDGPVLLERNARAVFSGAFDEASSSKCGGNEAWWCSSAEAIAFSLDEHGFAVMDGFLGSPAASLLRDHSLTAWSEGRFRPSRTRRQPAGEDDGSVPLVQERASRSDYITFDPPGMGALSSTLEALVCALRDASASCATITCRQRPMVARYGFGDGLCDARDSNLFESIPEPVSWPPVCGRILLVPRVLFAFARGRASELSPLPSVSVRHVDNHCVEGQGPHCNGRLLTAVYYMQPGEWDAREDGGCLRIFGAQDPPCDTGMECPAATPARYDVSPMGDRLVLFFSDHRCPHEVLPVRRAGAERFAATVWFWSGDVRVPPWWDHAVHDCTLARLPPPGSGPRARGSWSQAA